MRDDRLLCVVVSLPLLLSRFLTPPTRKDMVTTTRERTWYAISVTQGNPGWLLLNRIDRLLLIVLVRAGALVEQAIAPFETLVARMAQSAELATGGRFG